MNAIDKIKNLLREGSQYWGGDYGGYQVLRTYQGDIPGQRDPVKRLQLIPINFQNKSVLDLGCNSGGMLFPLNKKLSFGIGLDGNYKLINAANKIKKASDYRYLDFYTFDLIKDDFSLIKNFFPYDTERVDVCFLLSMCIHIPHWKDLIDFSISIADEVIFESNGSEEEQAEQIDYINDKFYCKVLSESSDDDKLFNNRKLFHLHGEF